jgi:antitoxin VapB
MSKEYRAKIFKSGNSMALRLPKALGFEDGSEMVLREMQNGYSFEPVETPKRKLDVAKFWGMASGMVHIPEPRRDFEPRPSSLRSKP